MPLSPLDLFTIGIGPSSSHTVGPMRAAYAFLHHLQFHHHVPTIARLQVRLYGSLALTGIGHATDKAVIAGLLGHTPEEVDPQQIPLWLENLQQNARLSLTQEHSIEFILGRDLIFEKDKRLPAHSNGMEFLAWDRFDRLIAQNIYYSVGGGFVMSEEEMTSKTGSTSSQPSLHLPYPFASMAQLRAQLQLHAVGLIELLLANDHHCHLHGHGPEPLSRADAIWAAMRLCTQRGLHTGGLLPGGLEVRRRAGPLWKQLTSSRESLGATEAIEWLSVYALAVNEENAAGQRVVTAPTNGGAGVIPAVMHYLIDHELSEKSQAAKQTAARHFLLVAGAIGMLYKLNASISAAEMGCQGEIGVASSMAAAAYCHAHGGTIEQIEAAAEIAMEHHLGMTCDPVAGLVQIPCIERNTMGAVKAVTAAKLALRGDGRQRVTLDQVIRTMYQTGQEMDVKYKETALGGLALHVAEC